MRKTGQAPGKIILSGEYAVVFGSPGIAVPAPLTLRATFEQGEEQQGAADQRLKIRWTGIAGGEQWEEYARSIVHILGEHREPFRGTLSIQNGIPLQKGLGSSTALIVAVTRAVLGEGKRAEAIATEDRVNPGHSGIDFAVIWEEKPLFFRKGKEPQPIALGKGLLADAVLIDTGTPNETTPKLVAWVRERAEEPRVRQALDAIGRCTERLAKGKEDIRAVIRDHHRAQVALGVVPKPAAKLIAQIEAAGGAAKVVGAGARSGGGGMVLAFGTPTKLITANRANIFPLHV